MKDEIYALSVASMGTGTIADVCVLSQREELRYEEVFQPKGMIDSEVASLSWILP